MSETQPFVFLGCLELNELLPHEAHDARELLEQLERVPIESVFCHTSASLLHRPVLAEAYPNDFSLWVGTEVRDVRLAERLAGVDAFHAGSMERVREELIATISDHLQHLGTAPPRSQGKRFRFFQVHLVPVPTGHQARTLVRVPRRARRGGHERALLPHDRGALPRRPRPRRLRGVGRRRPRPGRPGRSPGPHRPARGQPRAHPRSPPERPRDAICGGGA